MRLLICLGLAMALSINLSTPAAAQLTIEITRGADNPAAIAIVPFEWRGGGQLPEDIAGIVGDDLQRVGAFAPVAVEDMLSLPHAPAEVHYRDWRAIGAEYLLVGRVTQDPGSAVLVLEYALLDVNRQRELLRRRLRGSQKQLRDLAHRISDEVYQDLTGVRGAFSTQILYVVANSLGGGNFRYQLKLADADGARDKVLVESGEPILSPAWSPDGSEIAYVSFESGRPAIYRHQLSSGQREQLASFPGLNSAPAWSPDGNRLAFVLSKDGSPDIFVMELDTRRMKKVAAHYAIDTEPSWMPDGKSLIFTSDRGGRPQIYRVELASNRVERLTFKGDYNARGHYLPERNALIMVHRPRGERAFHIAVQNLKTGDIRLLSQSAMDESPTVAPNGAMLLYATRHRGRGILAGVSVEGGVRFRLPSGSGDAREPAWSPFLP